MMKVVHRGKARAAAPPAQQPLGDMLECPLCVEPMDETDINFKPCPCGYLVCVFCYHRLKELCSGLCPNCRREYGSAVPADGGPDAGPGLRDADNPRALTGAAAGSRAGIGAGGGGNDPSHITYAAANAARAAHAAAAAAAARPAQAAGAGQGRKHENGVVPGRGQGRAGDDAPALPSAAMWAAPGAQRQPSEAHMHAPAQPPAPAIADASAWPDLAAAAQPPPPPPQPPRAPPRERVQPAENGVHGAQHHRQAHNHNRQALHGGAAAGHAQNPAQPPQPPAQQMAVPPPAPPQLHVTPMTHDPVISPEQLGIPPRNGLLAGANYQNVQVSTHAFGQTRTVGVTLAAGLNHVEALPEAQGVRARVEQAVSAGTMTTQEATHTLLALLRGGGKEPEVQQPRAARPPPPGFAAPQQAYGGDAGQALTAADSPVPPIGRLQPIGTPIGPRGGVQQQQVHGLNTQAAVNGRYANGVAKPAPGMYNMWGGALSGIHLATIYGAPVKHGADISFQPWLNNGHDANLPAGSIGMGYNGYHGMGPVQPNAPGGGRPPPPGFASAAPPPGFAPQPHNPGQDPMANGGDLVSGWYQGPSAAQGQPQGMPNAARGPPPGMAAYRQQLGTGA